MTDLLLRSAERGEDLVAKLAARLRSGGVTSERVAYAAALGYGPALELGIEPAGIPPGKWDQARDGALLLGQREAVLWACDCAEDELRKYWTVDDPRPWEAVAAARAWAEDPSEENRLVAVEAVASALAVAVAVAVAEAVASTALAASAAASAAWAAEEAAWAAEEAARAAASAAACDEAWSLYLGWLAERLCWGTHD